MFPFFFDCYDLVLTVERVALALGFSVAMASLL